MITDDELRSLEVQANPVKNPATKRKAKKEDSKDEPEEGTCICKCEQCDEDGCADCTECDLCTCCCCECEE